MTNQNQDRREESFLFQIKMLVRAVGVLPLILLIGAYNRGSLGFNPIETALRQTGRTAVIFLLLSLACTPINRIFKLPWVGRLRKPLGLYAALYAVIHFLIFALWDYGFNFLLIWNEIIAKPFIIIGAVALVILIILAGTSFPVWHRTLGKGWRRLHRLVYVAALAVILHYLLAIKGDLLSLQGNYTAPLIAAGILVLLLILRIPSIDRFIIGLFSKEGA